MEEKTYNILSQIKASNLSFKQYDSKSWKKFNGDACVRVISEYLNKSLPINLKISPPNSYIVNCPIKFDLLILKRDAVQKIFTSAYKPEDVVCVIEVKAHGIFGKKSNIAAILSNIKDGFDIIKIYNDDIKCAYITIEETASTKNSSAINDFEETKKCLEPYGAFCLKDTRGGIRLGEWNKFVNYIWN